MGEEGRRRPRVSLTATFQSPWKPVFTAKRPCDAFVHKCFFFLAFFLSQIKKRSKGSQGPAGSVCRRNTDVSQADEQKFNMPSTGAFTAGRFTPSEPRVPPVNSRAGTFDFCFNLRL